MASSLSKGPSSDPLRLPETFGGKNLKVGIESEFIGIGPEVFEALVKYFGTVKELAYALRAPDRPNDPAPDPSQVRAEIKAADFRRLEKCLTPAAKVVVAEAVNRAYGKLQTADDDAEQAVTQLFSAAQRLAQYIAFRRTA